MYSSLPSSAISLVSYIAYVENWTGDHKTIGLCNQPVDTLSFSAIVLEDPDPNPYSALSPDPCGFSFRGSEVRGDAERTE